MCARGVFEAGQRLDAAGDWLGALQKYEQAGQIHRRGPRACREAVKRVREKLRAAGESAFGAGAAASRKSGRWADALKEYEKAVQWLPPDDPNRRDGAEPGRAVQERASAIDDDTWPARNPEKIGRYQILERVGTGGMGVLLRGIDPVLDREVAIKLMLVDFSEDAEQMRPRFYREARAAAKLQHPNIVTVFEFAEDGNTPVHRDGVPARAEPAARA